MPNTRLSLRSFSALSILFTLVMVAVVYAQTKTPTLTDSTKLKFFKAQSELIQAQQAAQQAAQTAQQKQATFQSVVEEIKKACGNGFEPAMNKDGEPECRVVTKAPSK